LLGFHARLLRGILAEPHEAAHLITELSHGAKIHLTTSAFHNLYRITILSYNDIFGNPSAPAGIFRISGFKARSARIAADRAISDSLRAVPLAKTAWRTMGQFGFSQVWTNDNLEYRVLASSAAIVARLPVKLGTAVTVPYFRNPVDLAMAFATMSELMDGREISLGLTSSILTSRMGKAVHDHERNWPRRCERCSPGRRSAAAIFLFSHSIFQSNTRFGLKPRGRSAFNTVRVFSSPRC
jgi:hypothetical protein